MPSAPGLNDLNPSDVSLELVQSFTDEGFYEGGKNYQRYKCLFQRKLPYSHQDSLRPGTRLFLEGNSYLKVVAS